MKKFILAVVIALAGIAIAADVVQKYPSDPSTFAGELDNVSSAETAALDSTAYANRVFQLGHNQNVTVSGSFSAASANAVIGIVRGRMVGTTFVPYSWAEVNFTTITADGTYTIGGWYVGSTSAFDTCNAQAAFVFVKSVSSGSVKAGWMVH